MATRAAGSARAPSATLRSVLDPALAVPPGRQSQSSPWSVAQPPDPELAPRSARSHHSKINRNGLKPGAQAPDFAFPDTDGHEVSLPEFAGRKVLLTFTQSGCRPCQALMPELKKLQKNCDIQVIVV